MRIWWTYVHVLYMNVSTYMFVILPKKVFFIILHISYYITFSECDMVQYTKNKIKKIRCIRMHQRSILCLQIEYMRRLNRRESESTENLLFHTDLALPRGEVWYVSVVLEKDTVEYFIHANKYMEKLCMKSTVLWK